MENSQRTLDPRSEKFTVSCTSCAMDAVCLIGEPPLAKVSNCWASSCARSEAFFAAVSRSVLGSLGLAFIRHEGEVAEDGGEQVVEIVRDAAGGDAERFELLVFAPLFLRMLPLGDVAKDEHDADLLVELVADRRGVCLDEPLAAVLRHDDCSCRSGRRRSRARPRS